MTKDKISIKKSMIPYIFDIRLPSEQFRLSVRYNARADFFVVGLYDKDNNEICAGEPVIYGMPLFQSIYMPGKYPVLEIVPFDESGETTRVTYDNFNDTVFLTINNVGGDNVGE